MPSVATLSEESAAFAAARKVCRRHAKSFYFASAFLERPKREAAYAVYAFCRRMDDAIDEADAEELRPPTTVGVACCTPTSLDAKLAALQRQLDDVYEGRLRLPAAAGRSEADHALHAFALTVHKYEIPKQYFLDLAAGCRMDLTKSRYATWASLETYCYHVAGVVGLIMSRIFGLTHEDAQANAVTMGNAMQLTNILRDVKEDYDRGRIYLPLEDLARFKYTERDLAAGVVNDAFRELMRFEIARARSMYRSGAEGLCRLEGGGSRLTASAMAVIYAGILQAIERQRYDVFSSRAHLTTGQKLARVPRAWQLARRRAGEPLPGVF